MGDESSFCSWVREVFACCRCIIGCRARVAPEACICKPQVSCTRVVLVWIALRALAVARRYIDELASVRWGLACEAHASFVPIFNVSGRIQVTMLIIVPLTGGPDMLLRSVVR